MLLWMIHGGIFRSAYFVFHKQGDVVDVQKMIWNGNNNFRFRLFEDCVTNFLDCFM